SLNYHAGGVKVAEMASWVGLGWSLSAGGMVTRTTMGRPDDASQGWLYVQNTLDSNACNGTEINTMSDIDEIALGQMDGEPDLFSFNVAGYSGKFYLKDVNTAVLIPQQDVKIDFVLGPSSSIFALETFVITPPDGTRYIFGKVEGDASPAIETQGTLSVFNYGSSWYLRRIVSADGQYRIDLKYTDEVYSYKSMGSWVSGSGNQISEMITNGKRLTEIETSTEKVLFSIDPSVKRQDLDPRPITNIMTAYPLQNIQITHPGNAAFCKQFDLSYDYFEDNSSYATGGSEDKRLRLLSVQQRSCDNTVVLPAHTFSYSGPVESSVPFLPNRFSMAIDHWGYYNGTLSNNDVNGPNIPLLQDTLIAKGTYPITPHGNANFLNYTGDYVLGDPFQIDAFTVGFPFCFRGQADRETHDPYVGYGTLRKITYPTGGYTEFDLEPHTYYGVQKETEIEPLFQLTSGACVSARGLTRRRFTAEEIPHLRYRLEKDFSICTQDPQYAYLKTFRRNSNGTWTQIASDNTPNNLCTQGNFTPANAACLEEGTLLDMLPCLEADRDYLFEIEFANASATFEVFRENSTTQTGNQLVGGLRVKQIRTHDGESSANDVIKTYNYDRISEAGKSSGLLYSKARYSYGSPNVTTDATGFNCGVLEGPVAMSVILKDIGVVPMGNFEGTHISYRRVMESCNGNGTKEFQYLME
ncbi:MAG: hypothetical protein AAFV25_23940, partial [Bacteroidota bacterium]